MFGSEVTLLKKENEEQSMKLREDDKLVIKDIMKSMSVFKVNSYDAQVIQRDLIGMALELKLRGSSLQNDIGEDVRGFTREIINNSSGPNKREILLNFLSKLTGYFFIWFIALAFVAYGRLSWEVNPAIYFYYFAAVLIIFITEGFITPFFCTEKGFKKNLQTVISIFLFVTLATIIYFIYDNQYTREVKSGYIIVVSGIVYLITKYLNVRNIHKLVKGKKNYIEDLK